MLYVSLTLIKQYYKLVSVAIEGFCEKTNINHFGTFSSFKWSELYPTTHTKIMWLQKCAHPLPSTCWSTFWFNYIAQSYLWARHILPGKYLPTLSYKPVTWWGISFAQSSIIIWSHFLIVLKYMYIYMNYKKGMTK